MTVILSSRFAGDGRFLRAKQPIQARRKLVGFDEEIWHALNLLSRDSMKTFQELADEAFRDLLDKYGRPTDLKAALRESARPSAGSEAASRRRSFMTPLAVLDRCRALRRHAAMRWLWALWPIGAPA